MNPEQVRSLDELVLFMNTLRQRAEAEGGTRKLSDFLESSSAWLSDAQHMLARDTDGKAIPNWSMFATALWAGFEYD